jgi:hypothetical protein
MIFRGVGGFGLSSPFLRLSGGGQLGSTRTACQFNSDAPLTIAPWLDRLAE